MQEIKKSIQFTTKLLSVVISYSYLFAILSLLIIGAIVITPATAGSRELQDKVTIVQLDSAKGCHVTTRTTWRRVWKYNGIWFVGYNTGEAGEKSSRNVYKTSRDGVTWSERKDRPGNAMPYFVKGFGYAHISKGGPVNDKSNIWSFRHWISTARIQEETIIWGKRIEFFKEQPNHMYFYYIQPRVTSEGQIYMTMRHVDRSNRGNGNHPRSTIAWFSNRDSFDLLKWNEPVDVIVGETPTEVADGHTCVPLDTGMCMVIARTSAGHYKERGPQGAFYARLFDGTSWKKQYKLDTSDGTGGSDRRFSATFDENAGIMHLVYTDGKKRLVYRTCTPPYDLSDWSEPYYPVKVKCFTQVIGLDRSMKPARPVIVYGRQRKSDGGRLHVGELYLIRYNGANWSKPILVSEKGRKDNWYPNMIEDCSGEIGIVYLRNFYGGKAPKEIGAPWDIMFSKVESDL